jgi:DNA-binding transcriptional regulator YiaG
MDHPKKECYQCNEIKALYEFGQCLRSKDNVNTTCLKCQKARKAPSEIETIRENSIQSIEHFARSKRVKKKKF